MSPTLEEACGLLLQNDDAVFKVATETLFKICQNLLQHPGDAKFRSLARSSATFSQKIGTAKGAVRFLKAVGFEEEGGSGEGSSLVLPPAAESAEKIAAGKAALKAVLKQHTEVAVRRTEAERQAENAAAAQKLADLREVSKKNTATRDANAEAERQRLVAGIREDKDEDSKWRSEYDAMGLAGNKPVH